MTPSEAEILDRQLNLLYANLQGWEDSTLSTIGQRIKKIGKMDYEDVISFNNIAAANADMDRITKELAKVTGKNVSEIERIYSEALEREHLKNKPLYDYRGKAFVPFAENTELQAIAKAYTRTTAGEMMNISKVNALGFWDDGAKTFTNLRGTIFDTIDKATLQVTTAATDFNTAMTEAVKTLGGSGVRVAYDSAGKVTRSLESVVRQAVLWGAKQAHNEYNSLIGEYLGCDGFEVDWHTNPRPSHEFMQGKQFSYHGTVTINGVRYEDGKEALERLEDYGCLHFATDIILGISEPAYDPGELKRLNEENARPIEIDGVTKSGYDWKQQMRALERHGRELERQRAGLVGMGNSTEAQKATDSLQAVKRRYNEIAKGSGIKAQPNRMKAIK